MPQTTLSLPVLSEYDPADGAEGSIDPLGLYPIADDLATLLAPGVRERDPDEAERAMRNHIGIYSQAGA